MRLLLRRAAAILVFLSGAMFIYFFGLVATSEVAPQIQESGLSLQGSSMILNYEWQGNQLYILLTLYGLIGLGLIWGAVTLWRGKSSRRPPASAS